MILRDLLTIPARNYFFCAIKTCATYGRKSICFFVYTFRKCKRIFGQFPSFLGQVWEVGGMEGRGGCRVDDIFISLPII